MALSKTMQTLKQLITTKLVIARDQIKRLKRRILQPRKKKIQSLLPPREELGIKSSSRSQSPCLWVGRKKNLNSMLASSEKTTSIRKILTKTIRVALTNTKTKLTNGCVILVTSTYRNSTPFLTITQAVLQLGLRCATKTSFCKISIRIR